MLRKLLLLVLLAGLGLLLAPPGWAGGTPTLTFTFTTGDSAVTGSYAFGHTDTLSFTGLSNTVTLASGQTATFQIDTFVFSEAGPPGLTGIYDSEVVARPFTVGSVSQKLSQSYNIAVGYGGSNIDEVSLGQAFGGNLFNLGPLGTVFVQPLFTFFYAQPNATVGPFMHYATFQYTAAPAPEPSAAVVMSLGFFVVGACHLAHRRWARAAVS